MAGAPAFRTLALAAVALQTSFLVPWAGEDFVARAQEPVRESRAMAAAQELLDLPGLEDVETWQAWLNIHPDVISEDLSQALIDQGERLQSENQPFLAVEAYRMSAWVAERVGDTRREAASEGGIGGILMFAGAGDQALYHLGRSLDLWERAEDQEGVAAALNSLGNAHYLRQQFETAEEYYGRSLVLAGSLDDVVGRARALNNLGLVASSTGDYGKALERLLHSLRLREELGVRAGTVGTLTNIGNVYRYRGNYDQALAFHQRSLDLSRELGSQAGASTAHNNIGNLHYLAGRYEEARHEYETALPLAQQSGDRRGLANLWGNLAMVHYALGDNARALAYSQQALELKQELGAREGAATQQRYVAAIHLDQGRFGEALRTARQAEQLGREIGGRETLWGALTIVGKAQLGLGRLEAARAPLEEATEIIEAMRIESGGSEQAQQQFFENKLAPYRARVELALRQKQPEEALLRAERVKARVLLDVLGGGLLPLEDLMTPDQLERDRGFTDELGRINRELVAADTQAREVLESERDTLRIEYESWRSALFAAEPQLRLQRGESLPVSPWEVEDLLAGAGGVIVEYVIGAKRSHVIAVRRDRKGDGLEYRHATLELEAEVLRARVEAFRSQLATRDLGYRAQARSLYQLLLEPIEPWLREVPAVILVPDASLWELPFQALVDGEDRFLVERAALTYAPSLTVLREMTSRARPPRAAAGTVLALAGPDVPVAGGSSSPAQHREVVPLPEAAEQVKQLREVWGVERVQSFVGSAATEAVAVAALGRHRVVHVAGHAVLNDRAPLYSYLVLAPDPQRVGADGLLEAREILPLTLEADLVVLSACDTARGRVGAGEGVIGLSWALLVAGTPTAVLSQWPVEAGATLELMGRFHRELEQRSPQLQPPLGTAQALRAAALSMFEQPDYRHPFYWAGFIVVGDGR